MGRPRNDSAINAARGTAKKASREYDHGDAAAPPGVPEMPDDFSPREIEIWDDTIFRLKQIPGLLTIVDGPTIADFCRCVAQKEIIERAMNIKAAAAATAAKEAFVGADGKVLKGSTKKRSQAADVAMGDVMLAYQSTLERLRMRQNALANELGMSPRSRSQIKVRAPGFVSGRAGTEQSSIVRPLVTDPSLRGGSGGLVKM